MTTRPFQIQQRFRELGRIRLGEKGPKGQPLKRDTFRLTSSSRPLLEEAARIYGGTVAEWKDAPTQGSQWELDSEVSELNVLVPPQPKSRPYFELWSGGGCLRRCDGDTELLSGQPCLCRAEEVLKCKPHTHLIVILHEIPDMGIWRLTTSGWNAASELPGTIEILQRIHRAGGWPEAVLAIEHRTAKADGQTHHFTVPVLKIRHTIGQLLSAPERQIPLHPSGRPQLPEARPEIVIADEPTEPALPAQVPFRPPSASASAEPDPDPAQSEPPASSSFPSGGLASLVGKNMRRNEILLIARNVLRAPPSTFDELLDLSKVPADQQELVARAVQERLASWADT